MNSNIPDRFNSRVTLYIKVEGADDVLKEFANLENAYMWIVRNTDPMWTRKTFLELSVALDEMVSKHGIRLASVCAAQNGDTRIHAFYGAVVL